MRRTSRIGSSAKKKGPRDRLRAEQMRKFERLADMTAKPVRLLEFGLA
jgi:hypothetical protein